MLERARVHAVQRFADLDDGQVALEVVARRHPGGHHVQGLWFGNLKRDPNSALVGLFQPATGQSACESWLDFRTRPCNLAELIPRLKE